MKVKYTFYGRHGQEVGQRIEPLNESVPVPFDAITFTAQIVEEGKRNEHSENV